jgi:hypothetical protein
VVLRKGNTQQTPWVLGVHAGDSLYAMSSGACLSGFQLAQAGVAAAGGFPKRNTSAAPQTSATFMAGSLLLLRALVGMYFSNFVVRTSQTLSLEPVQSQIAIVHPIR